jgi:hypothetical protein
MAEGKKFVPGKGMVPAGKAAGKKEAMPPKKGEAAGKKGEGAAKKGAAGAKKAMPPKKK